MTPIMPVEIVAVAALAFLVVLALAQAYTSLKQNERAPAAERKSLETARNEPRLKTSRPIKTNEPNRRNQSQFSRLARYGGQ